MKRAVFFPAAIVLLLALTLWASDIRMTGGPVVPSAVGIINLDRDHNGNTMVKVKVHHLARPSSLPSPKSVYVVWLQASDREPDVAGELRVDKDLNGEFDTRTPYKNFDVFITAEDTPHPERPSGPVVLRGSVQQ
jgi:hypothetical protein